MKSSTVISFEAEKQKRGYIGNKLYNMEENNIMDDLLKLYIEKVDRDQSDLRKDISESEKFMWGIIITILLSIIGSIGVITATYFSTISLLKDML